MRLFLYKSRKNQTGAIKNERKKFNELAKKDGKLFKLISDNNYPWYIDRLQGGGYIDEYQYNTELIDSLGNFYGFQMHEWISNIKQKDTEP